jgi:hypothetical protein
MGTVTAVQTTVQQGVYIILVSHPQKNQIWHCGASGKLGEEIMGIGGNYICPEWGGNFGSFHMPSERMLTENAECEYAVT